MAFIFLTPCLFASISACDSGESNSSEKSLVGDWLPCTDATCTDLNDDGYRFGADGSATRINGTESPVADAPICIEVEEAVGKYQFDGSKIILQGLTLSAVLDDDRLTLRDVPSYHSNGDTTYVTVVFIRLPTYVDASCSSISNTPAASAQSGRAGKSF
jgi:hypothetical protein